MILTRLFLVALYSSMMVVFDLPHWCLPDLAVALSVQAGLRARGNEDLWQALALGLTAGVFTSEPWTLSVLHCVLATMIASILARRIMPRRVSLVVLLAVFALLSSALGILALRLSVPSLTLTLRGAFVTLLRSLLSVPVVVMFDLSPDREADRLGWR